MKAAFCKRMCSNKSCFAFIDHCMMMIFPCRTSANPFFAQDKAMDIVLPVAYLFMLHPHEPARSQSHILFCSILRHANAVQSPTYSQLVMPDNTAVRVFPHFVSPLS